MQSSIFRLLQNFQVHWLIRISFQGDCQWIEGLPAVFLVGLPAVLLEGLTPFTYLRCDPVLFSGVFSKNKSNGLAFVNN